MAALTDSDWHRIFAKAWTDPAFNAAYEADPRAAIRTYAADLGVDPEATFSFPAPPEDMDAAALNSVAEGTAMLQISPFCC